MGALGLQTIGSPALWAGFLIFVVLMLALDLGVFHRRAHRPSLKEALGWSAVWLLVAGVFNVAVYHWFGGERAAEFAAGYLIEKALAVDNLFVFVAIFSAFKVSSDQQHRVLFWGVLGALVMRGIFVVVGGLILQRFHWMLYGFGALLVLMGVQFMRDRRQTPSMTSLRLVRLVGRLLPLSSGEDPKHFFVREAGVWKATSLFLALLVVEVSDLVFAVDSIPAVFAVTSDPFIVFTSNVLAIMGMRSLYFLLASMVDRFRYLKLGLAAVLVFVGAKMLLADVYKIPVAVSLAGIAVVLGGSVVLSLWPAPAPRRQPVQAG